MATLSGSDQSVESCLRSYQLIIKCPVISLPPRGLLLLPTPPAAPCCCSQNSKKKDVRITNIEAAKAVADAVRTSLGPRGMDKMVSQLPESMSTTLHADQWQDCLPSRGTSADLALANCMRPPCRQADTGHAA